MSGSVTSILSGFRVILVRTKDSKNLGMVARAMKNMGLEKLTLVSPQCEINEESHATAVGCGGVLDSAERVDTIPEAVKDCARVIGFTRRVGKRRRVAKDFRDRVREWATDISENPTALVFGPEDYGLSTEDLSHCTERVRLPTADEFPSINLAQAVLIVAYETFLASRDLEGPRKTEKKLASSQETADLYTHMEEALTRMRYFGARSANFAMACFRDVFARAGLTPDEVRMWRGVFARVIRLAGWLEEARRHPRGSDATGPNSDMRD